MCSAIYRGAGSTVLRAKKSKRNSAKSSRSARPGAPRLVDVARVAGVSQMTASRALGKPELVSEETQRRVKAAVAQLGYVPNLLAGGLASKRSRVVAAVVPHIAGSIFNETIESMIEELAAAGYQVTLGLGGSSNPREDVLIESLLSRRPDGMILTGMVRSPATRSLLRRADVPVVEIWDLPADPIDMVVGFSHERVGAEVAAFMLKRGYRRPHILCADGPRAHARRQGFVKALLAKGKGKREPPCELAPAPGSVRAGREGLAKLLTRGDRPDFIMCSSDMLALGVLLEAAARGLRIPEDFEIFGFGDMQFAVEVTPPLNTVRIDGAMIGRQTAKLLLQRAAGRKPEQSVIDVGFTIVDRTKAR